MTKNDNAPQDRASPAVSADFCEQVFGAEHRTLGALFEAFEIVPGWGWHPSPSAPKTAPNASPNCWRRER